MKCIYYLSEIYAIYSITATQATDNKAANSDDVVLTLLLGVCGSAVGTIVGSAVVGSDVGGAGVGAAGVGGAVVGGAVVGGAVGAAV